MFWMEIMMSSKTMLPVLGGILLAAVLIGYRLTSRTAYENAAYELELVEGDFEIRRYPELTLASTPMQGSRVGEDGSFMRLFGYISGENARQQKIAMTVPVFMQSDSEEAGSMQFVVPTEVAENGAPEPSADNVSLATRPAGRYAVVRFAGDLNDSTYSVQHERLETWMESLNLSAVTGSVSSAGYDPPWTPGFLRRNEVLVRIENSETNP